MSEVRNLTVHKNTLHKRKAKEVGQSLAKNAKALSKYPDLDGFCILAWNKDGDADGGWRLGSIPEGLFKAFIADSMDRLINEPDEEEEAEE